MAALISSIYVEMKSECLYSDWPTPLSPFGRVSLLGLTSKIENMLLHARGQNMKKMAISYFVVVKNVWTWLGSISRLSKAGERETLEAASF
jgi:hypothetical protein